MITLQTMALSDRGFVAVLSSVYLVVVGSFFIRWHLQGALQCC